MIEKPMTWKEFRQIHKSKKIHKYVDRIEKFGIILFMEDLEDFWKEFLNDTRNILRKKFDEFLDEELVYTNL